MSSRSHSEEGLNEDSRHELECLVQEYMAKAEEEEKKKPE
jgi:hypothetical protein